ncbi:MAG: thioesterase family protein [Burkholderiales bacterium]
MSGPPQSAPPTFEPAFIAGITAIFEERIPFNRLLGLRLDRIESDSITAHIEMRPELIGNYEHHRLHGGVISATLDTVGGLAVLAGVAARHGNEPPEQQLMRFGRIGTVDLRVDYLRQGIGARFEVRANVLRLGSRLASTRMEFLGEAGELVAAGAGTYIVS